MDVRLREVQQRLSDKQITVDVDEHGTCSICLRNDSKTCLDN